MKLDVFSFDSKQNTKVIAQIARAEGITDVDAFIVWLDNNMREQKLKLFRGEKQEYAIQDNYTVRPVDKKKDAQMKNSIKSSIIKANEQKKRLLARSKPCPECESGRLVVLPGLSNVEQCVWTKSFGGGAVKMEHGCGYSRMVG